MKRAEIQAGSSGYHHLQSTLIDAIDHKSHKPQSADAIEGEFMVSALRELDNYLETNDEMGKSWEQKPWTLLFLYFFAS